MTDYAQYNLRRRDNPQHVYALGSDLDGFPESTNQTLSRILMGGSNKRRKLATKSNVAACELCGETLASSSSLSTDKSSLCDTCTKQSSTPSTTLSSRRPVRSATQRLATILASVAGGDNDELYGGQHSVEDGYSSNDDSSSSSTELHSSTNRTRTSPLSRRAAQAAQRARLARPIDGINRETQELTPDDRVVLIELLNDLKQEKSSCQGSSQMETLQRENAVLRAELLEVQQRRLRDQLLFLNSQKEYQQMKSEHSTLELELDLANDQVDKLESQSTDKQKQLQALYAQIGQLEKQLAAASSAPVGSSVTTKLQEEAAKQLKLREGENTKLKSLIGQLEAELKSSQETNVAFQQALRSSEDQLNMLRQQMQMLQAQQMQYQQQVAMQQQMHYAGYARQMQYAAAAAAGAKMTY